MAKLSPERLQTLIAKAEAELQEPPKMTVPSPTKRGRPKGSKNKPRVESGDVATTLLHNLPASILHKLTLAEIVAISKAVSIDKVREPMHIASDDSNR